MHFLIVEYFLLTLIVEENELVDEIESITTDTHIVNTIDAVNQVGQRIPHNELIGKIQELIKEAKEDLEDSK